MPRATWSQTSFLGGEWSPFMQGRADHPRYKTALSVCFNALPTEEGAFQRRPGFKHVSRTKGGGAARVMPFSSNASTPYMMELGDGYLRMFNGTLGNGFVYNDDIVVVSAISSANPAVITIAADKGWATNDEIVLFYDGTGEQQYPDVCSLLKRRVFKVTRLTGVTYSIVDAVTGTSINGANVNFHAAHVPTYAASIMTATTPWTGTTWETLRLVQNQQSAVMLQGDTEPYTIEFTKAIDAASFSAYCGTCNNLGSVAITRANMLDGPYLDIDQTGAFLVPSVATPGVNNVVEFTIAFPDWDANVSYAEGAFVLYDDGGGVLAYVSLQDDNLNHAPAAGGTAYWDEADAGDINGPGGFTSDDIGRCVRILSTPPLWAAGTTYAIGDPVTYNGLYYTAQDASTGDQPDTNLDKWAPTTSLAVATWTWGTIIDTGTGTDPRFTLEIKGPEILYFDSPNYIYTFRFGVFGAPITSNSRVGWPTCGTFHQGRLWLSGAVPNRVDGSRPNGRYFEFTPTGPDGTIADDNGISITFNTASSNFVRWMLSMAEGVLCGTDGGEWLIAASQLMDPLTPTSIQAHRKTKYGCADIDPVETGMSTVFVQKFGRRVFEYVADVFSGKFSAPNLTEAARQATLGGVLEIAFQDEQVPIVWARRDGDSSNNWHTELSGCTYRRNSSFVTDQPSFAAWHRHVLGGNSHIFKSLCVTPSDDGTTTVLNTVTYDANAGSNGHYRIQQMTTMPEDTQEIYTSFYLDDAIVPPPIEVKSDLSGVYIYGLWHLEGQAADVWLDGVDCGDFTVTNGKVFVPFGADDDGLLTLANMQGLSADGEDFGICATTFAVSAGTVYNCACVVGHAFTTIGQTLRPSLSSDVGTPLGPPMGKTRRGHRYAMHVSTAIAGTVQMATAEYGTVPATGALRPVQFTYPDQATTKPKSSAFSGVYTDDLEDDYGYDSMLYWTIERPYPFTLLALSTFLASEER